MRGLTMVAGVVALLLGIILTIYGAIYPSLFVLPSTASAIQVGELYTEAIFRVCIGIAALVLGLICTISYYGASISRRMLEILEEVEGEE